MAARAVSGATWVRAGSQGLNLKVLSVTSIWKRIRGRSVASNPESVPIPGFGNHVAEGSSPSIDLGLPSGNNRIGLAAAKRKVSTCGTEQYQSEPRLRSRRESRPQDRRNGKPDRARGRETHQLHQLGSCACSQ